MWRFKNENTQKTLKKHSTKSGVLRIKTLKKHPAKCGVFNKKIEGLKPKNFLPRYLKNKKTQGHFILKIICGDFFKFLIVLKTPQKIHFVAFSISFLYPFSNKKPREYIRFFDFSLIFLFYF